MRAHPTAAGGRMDRLMLVEPGLWPKGGR